MGYIPINRQLGKKSKLIYQFLRKNSHENFFECRYYFGVLGHPLNKTPKILGKIFRPNCSVKGTHTPEMAAARGITPRYPTPYTSWKGLWDLFMTDCFIPCFRFRWMQNNYHLFTVNNH